MSFCDTKTRTDDGLTSDWLRTGWQVRTYDDRSRKDSDEIVEQLVRSVIAMRKQIQYSALCERVDNWDGPAVRCQLRESPLSKEFERLRPTQRKSDNNSIFEHATKIQHQYAIPFCVTCEDTDITSIPIGKATIPATRCSGSRTES